jgi:type VI protein secretion system component Hcp
MKMTTSLFPLLAALVVVASPSMAQSRTTVTFSDGTACTGSPSGPPAFVALSVSVKATVPKSTTGSSGREGAMGPVTFDDIAFTRGVDDCSVSLYNLLFKESHIKTVVISFQNYTVFGWKEALKITLGGVLLSSMSDTDTATTTPAERVSLSFDTITILDPVTNKSTTCNVLTNACGS